MKSRIAIFIIAFLTVPILMFGASNSLNKLVDDCLVRVYHTDFEMPPQGGEIVTINGKTYFARTYAPECQGATQTTSANSNPSQEQSNTTSSKIVEFFVGDECLSPVYHTDFAFPPEGGKVVRIGDDLFFVSTYIRGCENAGSNGVVVKSGPGQPIVQNNTGGGKVIELLAGDNCLVEVYHTDFAFPPEGGKIVKIGNRMYFVRTYVAGCENAGSNGTVIR